ncbi:MAG: ABC transporter permease [Tabrizicola sp.]|nr:ABC transporter permease [Tabrizicola sp.]
MSNAIDLEAAGRLQSSWYAAQECLRSALVSIRAHKLRSSLTMLGIVIGVASVICVIALVQGLSQSISNQLQGLGGSTLTLRSYTPFEDQLRGKRNRLRLQDLEELRFRIDGISNITPIVFAGTGLGSQVRHGSNTANGQMFGTTANYQDVQRIFPKSGRFLTASDDASRRRVVVLGEQMRKDLKLPETLQVTSCRSVPSGSRSSGCSSHAVKCSGSVRTTICSCRSRRRSR